MSSKKKPVPAPKSAPSSDANLPAAKPCVYIEFGPAPPRARKSLDPGSSRRPSAASKEILSAAATTDAGDEEADAAARSNAFRFEFELQNDATPKTCENFKQLIAGGATVGDKKNSRVVGYKGTRVLRVQPFFMQCGDVLNRDDGKGQDSIYGPTFEDENLGAVPHRFGTLTMVNSGPNTNGSQFAIIMAENEDDVAYMNGRHVAFGALLGGDESKAALTALHATMLENPKQEWAILDCGVTDHPSTRNKTL
jgi:cyclophilin family peptidyl-prolyl cis-trans isomerase